jgi:flagellar FliL protein
MSAAAATPPTVADAAPPAPRGSKKKLIVIGAAVALVLLLVAGGGAAWWLKSKARAAAEAGDDEDIAAVSAKKGHADASHPPTFLPLDIFVVNLSDRDADRYAQVGIVLELDTPAFADQMRAYMPAVRNAILMILAHKTSRELLEREGKEQLAAEIMRETVRPMGIDIPAPEPISAAASEAPRADDEVEKPRPARKKAPHNPIRHVHFSSFIIQ